MLKLNIGGGDIPLPGFRTIDRKTGGEAYPLNSDVADGSVDEIRASHILEHFSHRDVPKVLAYWVRLLKPGGLLKVAVPDFAKVATAYVRGEPTRPQGYIMGGHVDEDDKHGTIFDHRTLFTMLEAAGLIDVEPWQSEIQDCASLPVSLNLQARKPLTTKLPRIKWAMSVPRLGFIPVFTCWASAIMQPLGLAPHYVSGAFWGQCLERAFEGLMEAENPPEWILTTDYDSCFDWATVRRLVLIAANHPEVDAVSSVQVKRGPDPLPLVSFGDGVGKVDGRIFDASLTKVHSAHFGLTLLRVEALKKIPHPWFVPKPGVGERWAADWRDDDIVFWDRWTEAGNSLYLANRCVIGHGDFMWAWPDQHFGVIYQTVQDYNEAGPPAMARR